jgi:diadenosine tetraphosphatase ApaH/serine/threonine PP2A family protein phosphatase
MQLPYHQVIDNDIYAFHASPRDDSEYLLEQTHADFNAVKHLNEIESQLKGIEQKIIVCGHSHISRIVQTENHLVINPGSVGLPAYSDDLPVYHRMQNFNPRACYAMLFLNENSVSIERYSVDYDFESAAQLAEKNNRNDWAQWIRTGKA